MMRLSFSIEDILRDDFKTGFRCTEKQCGSVSDWKKTTSSDGESNRSESPVSTTSVGSDDNNNHQTKQSRRCRTAILSWQKIGLENAFNQQQYPSVQSLGRLSKALKLPNYVTKVWFQNRRSKFRKDGNRSKHRNEASTAPYPVSAKQPDLINEAQRDDPVTPNVTIPYRRDELENREVTSDGLESVRKLQCNCSECLQNRLKYQQMQQNMPVLTIESGPCSCSECLSKLKTMEIEERRSTTCNCKSCSLRSHNEARVLIMDQNSLSIRMSNLKPQQQPFGLRQSKLQQLPHGLTADSWPGHERLIAETNSKKCYCSHCKYGSSYNNY